MRRRATGIFAVGGRFLLAGYSAGLALVLLLAAPVWLRQMRRGGKYREGWRERLGRVPARLALPSPDERVIWVHAVSVGEVLAAAPLIEQLRAALPEARVYVSTTTRTGQAIARARFGTESVFYFPADFAFAVRRWLRALRPAAAVLIESEFWPRMLFECALAGVPVGVVNARISPRSWPRYQRLRPLWQPLLGTLAFALAQTSEDAARLRMLGIGNAKTGGNLKYDLRPSVETELVAMLRRYLPEGAAVLVCGSTLDGEEEILLQHLPPEPVLLLAPRHPERFAAVAALLAAQARPWARVSDWRKQPRPVGSGTILLLDSIGELAALYAIATVAFVGGGWLHTGGHNPLEPAMLGRPTIIGPHSANFAEIVTTLADAHAVMIADAAQLRDRVDGLLAHADDAAAMGARAELVCRMHAGATRRAVDAIRAVVRS